MLLVALLFERKFEEKCFGKIAFEKLRIKEYIIAILPIGSEREEFKIPNQCTRPPNKNTLDYYPQATAADTVEQL